ncbi:MAG: universal stress protein [Acidobacteriota bacterium]
MLAGTSLESGSDAVVHTGLEVARRRGIPLHLCHAHLVPSTFHTAADPSTASPDLACEREVRERLLDEQLERLGRRRSELGGVTVAAGTPHRLLLDTADALDAGLLVLGARETDRPAWLGSTTDRVLRSVCCPVWVVDGEAPMPPRRLLAPVDLSDPDLSDHSRDTLSRGLDALARVTGPDCEVRLLFVLTPKYEENHPTLTARQIREHVRRELDIFASELGADRHYEVSGAVREGEVRDEIVTAAREHEPDLLLLGTHGRSGFERFLLGSVAADVAARARVSALIVPPCPPKAADPES